MRPEPMLRRLGKLLLCVLGCSLALCAQSKKIRAQALIDEIVPKHSDIAELEISAARAGEKNCSTIAATKLKQVGEKCDEDEATALKTKKPFVESEPDGFDVTAPLHDAKGKLVGTLGIDFKPQAGKTKSEILERTAALLHEIEPMIPSKGSLYESSDNSTGRLP